VKKNRETRRAALEKVKLMGEGSVIPDRPTNIPETTLEELEAMVTRGYLEATLGEPLEESPPYL
jgi:hypothetical protein